MADANGWDTGLLGKIEDFRSDESISVPRDQGFIETSPGSQSPVITTKGWDVKFSGKINSLIGFLFLKSKSQWYLTL